MPLSISATVHAGGFPYLALPLLVAAADTVTAVLSSLAMEVHPRSGPTSTCYHREGTTLCPLPKSWAHGEHAFWACRPFDSSLAPRSINRGLQIAARKFSALRGMQRARLYTAAIL